VDTLGLPRFEKYGYRCPPDVHPEMTSLIAAYAREAVRRCGLRGTPAHVEFVVEAPGPRLLEVNPRLPGGFLPVLIELSYGKDYAGDSIRLATQRVASAQSPGPVEPVPDANTADLVAVQAAALAYRTRDLLARVRPRLTTDRAVMSASWDEDRDGDRWSGFAITTDPDLDTAWEKALWHAINL
jgi:hypothetical protein